MSHHLLPDRPTSTLPPRLTFWDMVLLGISPLLAMGLFVGLGIAAEVAGSALAWALLLTGGLALGNRTSAAQLAVAQVLPAESESPQPLRFLPSWMQFTAHWMQFLFQLTTAAVAALGIAGYGLSAAGIDLLWLVPVALLVTLLATVTVWYPETRQRRSGLPLAFRWVATAGAGLAFVLLMALGWTRMTHIGDTTGPHPLAGTAVLQATALLFTLYGSYAAILREPSLQPPRRQIPAVVGVTTGIALLLSLGVGRVALGVVGASVLGSAVAADAAPLLAVLRGLGLSRTGWVFGLAMAAILAMLYVLIEHIRALAAALPALAQPERAEQKATFPPAAEVLSVELAIGLVGVAIAGIVIAGDVQTIWGFSAFAVLIHNALVHLAALRLPDSARLYPRWLAGLGFVVCVGLILGLRWDVWLVGLGLISLGWVWRGISGWSDEPPGS